MLKEIISSAQIQKIVYTRWNSNLELELENIDFLMMKDDLVELFKKGGKKVLSCNKNFLDITYNGAAQC